ncbi:hypothetical protein EXIGLDRAFT_759000 [Exidia glandulosa HHB12029]|uniref:Uncharacterized protein n=1 Tax=Exidia glandulosa HHB12029 TaxID=1314781 RepID=A0A165QI94_EXIGL|nr:hypothetical protein EXIGLDRAFT_759000 [Exidia glandulosa HHB12029]
MRMLRDLGKVSFGLSPSSALPTRPSLASPDSLAAPSAHLSLTTLSVFGSLFTTPYVVPRNISLLGSPPTGHHALRRAIYLLPFTDAWVNFQCLTRHISLASISPPIHVDVYTSFRQLKVSRSSRSHTTSTAAVALRDMPTS